MDEEVRQREWLELELKQAAASGAPTSKARDTGGHYQEFSGVRFESRVTMAKSSSVLPSARSFGRYGKATQFESNSVASARSRILYGSQRGKVRTYVTDDAVSS
jgi:hypothetical protein